MGSADLRMFFNLNWQSVEGMFCTDLPANVANGGGHYFRVWHAHDLVIVLP